MQLFSIFLLLLIQFEDSDLESSGITASKAKEESGVETRKKIEHWADYIKLKHKWIARRSESEEKIKSRLENVDVK